MADDFYLDESAFEGVTDSLVTTGMNLDDAVKELNDVLLATEGCWGDDEIGKAFASNYWAIAEQVRTGMEGAGTGIVETARTMRKSAADLASVDEQTAKSLDSQIQEQ